MGSGVIRLFCSVVSEREIVACGLKKSLDPPKAMVGVRTSAIVVVFKWLLRGLID